VSQIGEPNALLVATRIGWSRQLGDYKEYYYEGSNPAIVSLAAQLRGTVDDYSTDLRGPKCSLTAKQSLDSNPDTSDQLVVEARLYASVSGKDIALLPAFDAMSSLEKNEVKKAVEEARERARRLDLVHPPVGFKHSKSSSRKFQKTAALRTSLFCTCRPNTKAN